MHQNKMEIMPIKKLVIHMSLPIIISMLVQALYNIVDSMFVARVSEEALHAVSLAYPVQTIMIALACGTGVGINALLSRTLGQKNKEKADQVVMHGLLVSIGNGILFLLFGIFGSRFFINLFTQDQEILQLGSTYLWVCCIFSVFVFIQITYERIMQATGNAFYNMVMQGIGALINIILDPIFIFGLNLGVLGAAIATILGQCVAMTLGIWITKKKIKEISISFSSFHWDINIIQEIYRVGIPAILIQSIMSFMTLLMNTILITFQVLAVTVFNIYFKLAQFAFMAINGLNNALIPIVSFNYGAKHPQRVQESIRFALIISIVIMLGATLVFQLYPKELLLLFDANQKMLEIGIPAMRWISLSFVPAGISIILCAALQASDRSMISLWITILRQLVILIPLTYGMMRLWGLDMGWISFVITEVICMFLSIYGYIKK